MLVGLAGSLAAAAFWPALLAAQSNPDTGLQVQGALAEYTVAPGQTLVHHMVISLGAGAREPMDILVEARGLGQALDGSVVALLPDEDSSPYSARSFIKNIDNTSFRLTPGASKEVNATLAVPAEPKTSYYADLYVHALPIQTQNLDIVLAAHVPVLLQTTHTGVEQTASIAAVDVVPVVSGRPIVVSSSVKNTGNHHFKTQTRVSLLSADLKPLVTTEVPFSGSSIVPTYLRKFTAAFGFLNHLEGMPAGTYFAQTDVSLTDGTLLDTKRVAFRITVPYFPFPDIDPANLVVVNYDDEVPHSIDARQKTDVELSFSGLDKVTGTVVLGKFRGEPPGATPFRAKAADGGAGKDGLKFVGIGVQGFSGGTGHLSVHYAENEIVRYSPASFVLGVRVADTWEPLGAFASLPGSLIVRGDVPVSALNETAIVGLGGDAVVTRVAGVQVQSGIPLEWVVLMLGGVAGLAVLIIVFLAHQRARPTPYPEADLEQIAE